jgi:hypothetical protein
MWDACQLIWLLIGLFRSRASLEAENLVLRQQIIVLRRTAPKRLCFMAHSDIFREGEELHFFDYYSEGSRGRHYRTMTPERIAALIAQFGQPVTLQRLTGTTTQVRHDVVCQAIVRATSRSS